jgi:peptide/nickel transport system ATP-binding protein
MKPGPGSPLLEVEHFSRTLKTARGLVHAVNNVSVTLEEGEALGIVGESGSGKTVLARSIANLLPRAARSYSGALRRWFSRGEGGCAGFAWFDATA